MFIVSWHLILSCKPSSHKSHLKTQTHKKNLMLERNINNLKMFNLSTLPKHTSIKVDWFLGKFAAGNIYFIQEDLAVPNNSKWKKSLFTLFWSIWFRKIISSDVCTMKQISRPIIFRNIKSFERRRGSKMSIRSGTIEWIRRIFCIFILIKMSP